MKLIKQPLNFLSHKASPQNWFLWVSVAALFKIPVFYFLISKTHGGYEDSFMLFNSDTSSYFDPIKNFISTGTYYDQATEGYRLPGYGLFYYVFHFFLSDNTLFNFIGILQLFCSILSVYVLGLLAQQLTQQRSAFYLAFFLYAISPFTSIFNSYLLTESFSSSFLVFGFYYLYNSITGSKINFGFVSGLFFTWSYFLRPSVFIIVPILVLFLLIMVFKKQIRLKHFIVFILPLIICSGSWVIHNYNVHKKFALLTHTLYYPNIEKTYMKSAMKFFNVYGYPQIIMPFVENGNVYYYLNFPSKNKAILIDGLDKYTGQSYTKDSIVNLVNLVNIIEKDTTISILEKNYLDVYVTTRFTNYRKDLIKSEPYFYYVKSQIGIIRQYFSIDGSGYSNLNSSSSIKEKILSVLIILYCYFHYFIVGFGILSGILMLFRYKKQPIFFQALIGTTTIILLFSIPLLLRLGETRYMVPAYPFLILCSTYIFSRFIINFQSH